MTNREAIEARIGLNYPIEDATFDAALLGIDPDGAYCAGKPFDLALIAVILTLIGSAERISEGGYTVQLNLDALYKLLSFLYRKWGMADPTQPYLVSKTKLW